MVTTTKPAKGRGRQSRKRVAPTARRLQFPREGFASIEDMIEFLQIGRSKIYKMLESGEIESTAFGRTRRVAWPVLHQMAKTDP